MLKLKIHSHLVEAGTDEAGRGCLAGPVVAAAVILPDDFDNSLLNDSKKISEKKRIILREIIEKEALAYAVAFVSPEEIDQLNILRASITAMHTALKQLSIKPEFIAVDGNKFNSFGKIPHQTVIKGDAKYQHIAAASILAKTYRDEYMIELHKEHPQYQWKVNKGYPTAVHRKAIVSYGTTIYHRKSFKLFPKQLKLEL
jgi:ribonuclease HII